MLGNNPYYWEILRKVNITFGRLFSDIKIQRKEKSGTKTVIQTIDVPIALGNRDKWVQRTEQDPDLTNQVYTTFPRMSYEMTSINPDNSRKLGKLTKITCRDENGASSVLAPVPYVLNFSLYCVAKTQEDCMQIVEQILPFFTPEYTVSLRIIDNLNIVNDIPFILEDVSISDDYEGDLQTRRTVIYTLTFSVKVNFYGPVRSGGLIKHVIVDMEDLGTYEAEQLTPTSPIIETYIE